MKKKPKVCAYCGKPQATERDHVPPKCFFPDRSGIQMITVPACGDCNRKEWYGSGEEIAKDEEYTRNIFVWEYFASRHPAAKKLLSAETVGADGQILDEGGAAYRSAKNDPRVNRIFGSGLHLRQMRMPNSSTNVVVPTLDYDAKRVNRVVRKIIRGLYYHETNEIFPDDYSINVFVLSLTPHRDLDRANLPAVRALLNKLSIPSLHRLADGVFSYEFAMLSDDPAKTLWVMSFYDGIFLGIGTFPTGEGMRLASSDASIPPGVILPS